MTRRTSKRTKKKKQSRYPGEEHLSGGGVTDYWRNKRMIEAGATFAAHKPAEPRRRQVQ